MYDYQNIGYQMPSAPNPMMQTSMGGYPAGYPPVAPPQMGFGMQMNPMGMTTGYGTNIIPPAPQMQPPMTAAQFAQGTQQAPDLSMPVPGVTAPLELEFSDGTKAVVPPTQQSQMAMGYTQG